MTRWLVVGAGGQLGVDLLDVLRGADAIGLVRSDLDITDAAKVAATLDEIAPDVVINAAAYTAVDAAESDEQAAMAVNATGPANLAAAARRCDARLVHVSTDYVFDGLAHEPYDEEAPISPRSAYGRTKAAGESAVLAEAGTYVVRTAWVYGAAGRNFVKTMARLEREREAISVVDDQRGSPTWSRDLAEGLVALAVSQAPGGVYHCTNAGATTWCGFARAIFEELGADPARVLAITSDAYPTAAPRPAYSVLGNRRWLAAGLPPLRDWRDALHAAVASSGDSFRAQSVS